MAMILQIGYGIEIQAAMFFKMTFLCHQPTYALGILEYTLMVIHYLLFTQDAVSFKKEFNYRLSI